MLLFSITKVDHDLYVRDEETENRVQRTPIALGSIGFTDSTELRQQVGTLRDEFAPELVRDTAANSPP
ncbi:MAG TPA: hypothetical protein VLA19_21105 [Herpetosiphonaceae bacterium]|nr:hypothetical protein [Herpetosiphonaceae bacterium]